MNYRNVFEQIGRLGADPVIFPLSTPGDIGVNISIATNKSCMKDGKPVTYTDWHTISIYGRHANYAKKALKKGTEVMITGKIRSKEVILQSGMKIHVSELVVNERNHSIMVLSHSEPKPDPHSKPMTQPQAKPEAPFAYQEYREPEIPVDPQFVDYSGYAPPPLNTNHEQY